MRDTATAFQIRRFCMAAREFGLVINPSDIALEMSATGDQVKVATQLLNNHTDIIKELEE